MKIGILSDIHGNSYALESVLKEVKREGIEKLLILGDCVGYYHHPDKVMNLLKCWDCEIIKGNHETILKHYLDEDDNYRSKIRAKYGHGHDAVLKKLKDSEIEYLIELPLVKKVIIDGVSIIMAHGSPDDNETYIYPDTDKSVLEKMDNEEVDFIFMGHTHYPFIYKGKHTQIINIGSVGQSRVMGGIANWGVLNTTNSTFVPKHTPYSIKKLIEELLLFENTPNYLIKILLRNTYG
jgi:putative phosphoesterase